MKGQCIAVVSGKGGTGKTSFVSGVGAALALSGRRVLCLDCDIGFRNLDLSLGLTDQVLMDFSDVVHGRCSLEESVVPHPQIPSLFLLTAPVRTCEPAVTEEDMRRLLLDVRSQFDYCLLDAPAGLGEGFSLAACHADRAIVVATSDLSSLRDAQSIVQHLQHFDEYSLHLVINRVRKKLLTRLHTTIDDTIDNIGIPLIGMVPEDDALALAMNRGISIFSEGGISANAFSNISQRLQGRRVPLLRFK